MIQKRDGAVGDVNIMSGWKQRVDCDPPALRQVLSNRQSQRGREDTAEGRVKNSKERKEQGRQRVKSRDSVRAFPASC